MSKTFHFYDPGTGLFIGRAYTGPDDENLTNNTPAGMAAATDVEDWQSQRVDPTTLEVVDYQPPAPADTELQTHAWDVGARRWVASPTLIAIQRQAHERIDAAAGAARLRYMTDVPGQQGTYLRKFEQAHAFASAGFAGTVPSYVAAEAQATGTTAQAVAELILATAAQWDDVLSPAIEGARIGGKRHVSAASTALSVQQALQAAITVLDAI